MLWWSMVEVGIGLVTACLPSLRILLGKVPVHSLVTTLHHLITRSVTSSTTEESKITQVHRFGGSVSGSQSSELPIYGSELKVQSEAQASSAISPDRDDRI